MDDLSVSGLAQAEDIPGIIEETVDAETPFFSFEPETVETQADVPDAETGVEWTQEPAVVSLTFSQEEALQEKQIVAEPEVYLDRFFKGLTNFPPRLTQVVDAPLSGSTIQNTETEEPPHAADVAKSMARLENRIRSAFNPDREIPAPHVSPNDEALTEDTPRGEAAAVIPTGTLAELYVRQGHLGRAISVYLSMVQRDPANPDIHKRLSELFVLKAEQEGT
ncbi:MAG: tetratricopeptide repeat protein [candidate division Zixibacteria bacterium]|nr:tetratricopeptide repeat protein [candidate division Zixibacteria bacterium]